MRYDTTIYFQKLTQGEYDQETGDYKEDSVSEDSRQASIMDTTTQMMQLVYGMIKQGSLTIQYKITMISHLIRSELEIQSIRQIIQGSFEPNRLLLCRRCNDEWN